MRASANVQERWTMRAATLTVLLLTTALGAVSAPAATAATPPTYKQLTAQVHALKQSRATWKRRAETTYDSLRTVTIERNRLEVDRDRVQTQYMTAKPIADQVPALQSRIAGLEGQIGILNANVTNLQAGLPDAIKAVAIADFQRLVFVPARAAWPCDSLYTSGSYWSYTFDSPPC